MYCNKCFAFNVLEFNVGFANKTPPYGLYLPSDYDIKNLENNIVAVIGK